MIPGFSDATREDMGMDRRSVMVIMVALVVVAGMGVLILTWSTITQANKDFRSDCTKLGGTTHELGSETICLLKDRAVGRHG